jgi:hypothetical protein
MNPKEDPIKEHLINALGQFGLRLVAEQEPQGSSYIDYVFLDEGTQKRFACEVKEVRDGRADRVIPQLAMAILQAKRYAESKDGYAPLAIVFVSNIVPSLLKQFKEFADEYAQGMNLALVTDRGAFLMRIDDQWHQHESLDIIHLTPIHLRAGLGTSHAVTFNPFSDLNQWMLKILIAGQLPKSYMRVPVEPIYSGSGLARVAGASPMSAHRLINHLKKERFLVETAAGLTLTRREELFSLWKSASTAFPAELPLRFLVRVAPKTQFQALLGAISDKYCLGLFTAAEQMGLGHVNGAPPYLIMTRLPVMEANRPEWRMVAVCKDGEAPDFIVRRTMTPNATFKAAVSPQGVPCTDVIQTWLDVSNHPTRGSEQADHIYKTVLKPMIARSQ